MSQSIFPITPTELTVSTPSFWVDVDASGVVPVGATGLFLHIINKGTGALSAGVRNKSASHTRTKYFLTVTHTWMAVGLDGNRTFQAYVESTTDIDIFAVAYTMAGVTFFANNGYDKTPATGAWTDMDCSSEAPGATMLIFELQTSGDYWEGHGFRENGSTENRRVSSSGRNSSLVVIPCDGSQIVEGYRTMSAVNFYLIGYITTGVTPVSPGIDLSLGSIGEWLDLSALPSEAIMAFIECYNTISEDGALYGLRENGSTEDYYYGYMDHHSWAVVKCDTNRIIEGKITTTNGDFYLTGYATAESDYIVRKILKGG